MPTLSALCSVCVAHYPTYVILAQTKGNIYSPHGIMLLSFGQHLLVLLCSLVQCPCLSSLNPGTSLCFWASPWLEFPAINKHKCVDESNFICFKGTQWGKFLRHPAKPRVFQPLFGHHLRVSVYRFSLSPCAATCTRSQCLRCKGYTWSLIRRLRNLVVRSGEFCVC